MSDILHRKVCDSATWALLMFPLDEVQSRCMHVCSTYISSLCWLKQQSTHCNLYWVTSARTSAYYRVSPTRERWQSVDMMNTMFESSIILQGISCLILEWIKNAHNIPRADTSILVTNTTLFLQNTVLMGHQPKYFVLFTRDVLWATPMGSAPVGWDELFSQITS